jgi:SecD/SecF fusion protein
MRYKGLIITLTVIVSVLCAYFLFFTYVSRGVQDKAVAYATRNGQLDETKRQHYLDSVWRAPVFGNYTYRDVKQSELGLGLDLKGGMHVTLEVSPVEIVRAMAGNSKDPAFNKAIALAQERQKTNSGTPFTTLFYQAYQETAPGVPLARIFANSVNKDRKIDLNSPDSRVLAAINKEEEDAIGRSFDILRKRVDKFGVNQPNIQRVKGTGRIQVELPGVDNPDRVRKLLQGQAKLEFYEVWGQNEVVPFLGQLDQILAAKAKAGSTVATAKTDSAATAKGDTTSLAAQLAKKTPANKAKTDSTAAQKGGPLASLLTMPGALGVIISPL